jgi:hypothetical protein
MEVQTVFMMVVIFILLYIVVRYVMASSAILTSLTAASTSQTVPASSLDGVLGTTSANFTYSIWFYLDDWNYNYGQNKILFARSPMQSSAVAGASASASAGDGSLTAPVCTGSTCCKAGMYFDKTSNYCVIGTAPATSGTTTTTGTTPSAAPSVGGSGGFADNGTISSIIPSPCPSVVFDATQNNIIVSVTCNGKYNPIVYDCMITNFPIQSWVNLLISVYGLALDIYLDGKLVKTCVLPGIPKVDPTLPLYITPAGGFSGWTSSFQYFNTATNPQEAWNIYQNGYGANWISSLVNQYSIKLSLMAGGDETSSISI